MNASGKPVVALGVGVTALVLAGNVTAEEPARQAGAEATAQLKQQCISTHHTGQLTRQEGDLLGAREQFAHCAQQSCPAPIRKECAQWLFDVEHELPTIVLRVEDDQGKAIEAAQVWIDDELVAERVDGRALSVNPGTHVIRVRLEGGEEQTSELLAHEGEKLQTVEVAFAKESPTAQAPTAAKPAETTPPDGEATPRGETTAQTSPNQSRLDTASGRDIPTATVLLGATGVAALAALAYFGMKGLGHHEDFDRCTAGCEREHELMADSYRAANIAGAVGVVSLGVGGAIWWASSGSDDTTTGFVLGASGRF